MSSRKNIRKPLLSAKRYKLESRQKHFKGILQDEVEEFLTWKEKQTILEFRVFATLYERKITIT